MTTSVRADIPRGVWGGSRQVLRLRSAGIGPPPQPRLPPRTRPAALPRGHCGGEATALLRTQLGRAAGWPADGRPPAFGLSARGGGGGGGGPHAERAHANLYGWPCTWDPAQRPGSAARARHRAQRLRARHRGRAQWLIARPTGPGIRLSMLRGSYVCGLIGPPCLAAGRHSGSIRDIKRGQLKSEEPWPAAARALGPAPGGSPVQEWRRRGRGTEATRWGPERHSSSSRPSVPFLRRFHDNKIRWDGTHPP